MNLLKNNQNIILVFAATISFFHIMLLWNFWRYGVNAVGINITIFWFLILGFYCAINWNQISKSALQWLIPTSLIILSLSLYTTFTTGVSLVLLPIIFFIFTTYTSHRGLRSVMWSRYFPVVMSLSIFHYLISIFKSQKCERKTVHVTESAISQKRQKSNIIKQSIIGVVVLAILSLGVVIPLLSSADEAFGRFFADILDWILDIPLMLSMTTLMKSLLFLVGLVLLLGFNKYWKKDINFSFTRGGESSLKEQSITIGIILGGIMALYLLFIGIQINTFLINSLPIDFLQTEKLVKSGFWQLFLLTILNILFYIGTYNRSSKNTNRLLCAFTISSLFLIFSAGYRVFLYVTIYGLSYEKLFAAYTVVYCITIFFWFLSLFFLRESRKIIVSGVVFLALWMYAFLAIFPVESFIFKTNLELTKKEDSRVNINELKMLKFDALTAVEESYDELIIEARKDFEKKRKDFKILESQNGAKEKWYYENVDERWVEWVGRMQVRGVSNSKYNHVIRMREPSGKQWYEKTINELTYNPVVNVEDIKEKNQEPEIMEWRDSLHGFSVRYAKSLRFDAGDSYTKTDLTEDDYWLTISASVRGPASRSVYFTTYNASASTPSENSKLYTKMLKQVQREGNTRIHLPNMPNIPAYVILARNHKTGNAKYALLFNLGNGNVGKISSNDEARSVADLNKVSTEEYINLITPHKELADVIKSFRIIDVE